VGEIYLRTGCAVWPFRHSGSTMVERAKISVNPLAAVNSLLFQSNLAQALLQEFISKDR